MGKHGHEHRKPAVGTGGKIASSDFTADHLSGCNFELKLPCGDTQTGVIGRVAHANRQLRLTDKNGAGIPASIPLQSAAIQKGTQITFKASDGKVLKIKDVRMPASVR